MPVRMFGIVLIMLGVLALVYGGFRYAWRDNVANVGPIHVNVQRQEVVLLPPMLGLVAIAGGAALIVLRQREG